MAVWLPGLGIPMGGHGRKGKLAGRIRVVVGWGKGGRGTGQLGLGWSNYFPFSSTSFCKKFQDFSSHRIFGRMHEALNINKK